MQNKISFIILRLYKTKQLKKIMKKNQITYALLTNTEFYQLYSLIAKSASDANPVLSKFKPEYDLLDAVLKRLLAALNQEKASEFTAALQKLDARRDLAISGFITWIKGLAKHPKPIKSEPAMVLLNFINSQGTGIATQNLQTETAILTKIVTDCKTELNLKNALTALDGNDWIVEIEQSNEDFIATYNNRSNEKGEDQSKESFFDVRKVAIPIFEALVEMIKSRYKIALADNTDITLLQKCVNEIEATITQYRQLIKATQTTKKDTPPAPKK